MKQLDRLLALIEANIDFEHCQRVDERYRRSLAWEPTDRPPLVCTPGFGKRWRLPAPWNRFEPFSYREAFNDPARMFNNMLLDRVVPGLILKDDSPLAIRADHGTIQIASLLGGTWEMHKDDYPWIKPFGSVQAIRSLVEQEDNNNWTRGVMERSTHTLQFYRQRLADYPYCRRAIQIALPDLQGPFDTAEMLWGSDIFLALTDDPQLLSAILDKIVRTMLAVVDYYRQFTYDRLDPFGNTQHGYVIPGRLLIRTDSSILVSSETYRHAIAPHEAKLLKNVGTGSIHFCGNGEHLVGDMLDIPDLCGLDLGQSETTNINRIFPLCAARNVAITNLIFPHEQLVSGQANCLFPTGVVYSYETATIDDARGVVNEYQRWAIGEKNS